MTTGAKYISEFVKENCTLQILNIGGNTIGDDGMAMVIEGLLNNRTITELWLWRCGLTIKGIALNVI